MDVAVPHVPHSVLHAPASACALPGLLGYRPLADITSGPMGLTSADPIVFTFSSQNGVSSGETSLLRSHAADRWHGRRPAAANLCCDKHPTTLCGGSMRTPTPVVPCAHRPPCLLLPSQPQASPGSASWATPPATSPTPLSSTTGGPAPPPPPTRRCQTGHTSLQCGRR